MSTSDYQEQELSDGEELVAYLDGELPPDVARRVEERLASDADYRDQLRELDQAWEALDVLPRTSVGDDFARTTIEMVAVAAEQDLSERAAKVAQASRWRRLRMAVFAVVATAAGFAAATTLLPNDDQFLLEHLPVIRQVDLLTQVNDVEFLQELSKVVTVEDLKRDAAAFEAELAAIRGAGNPSPEERKEWVRSLSPEDKQILWAQKDRFQGANQNRLGKLYEEIATADDAEELQSVLVAYEQWVSRRPVSQQAALRQLATAERVQRVRELVRAESWWVDRQLNDGEKQGLSDEIAKITDEYKDRMLEDQEFTRRANVKRDQLEGQRSLLELATMAWALLDEETRASILPRLIARLDPDTQEFAKDEENRRLQDFLFWGWVREVRPLRRDHDPQALMQFFAVLPLEQKESLKDLSPAQFKTAVAGLYEAQQHGLRELDFLIRRPRGRGQGGRDRGAGDRGRSGRGGRGGRGRGGERRGERENREQGGDGSQESGRRDSQPSGGEQNGAEANDRSQESGGDNGVAGRGRPSASSGPSALEVQQMLDGIRQLLDNIQNLLDQQPRLDLIRRM